MQVPKQKGSGLVGMENGATTASTLVRLERLQYVAFLLRTKGYVAGACTSPRGSRVEAKDSQNERLSSEAVTSNRTYTEKLLILLLAIIVIIVAVVHVLFIVFVGQIGGRPSKMHKSLTAITAKTRKDNKHQ